MKTLFWLVLLTSLLGTLGGYLIGRTNNSDGLASAIINNIHIENLPPSSQYYLTYICNTQPVVTYNVDKKILSKMDTTAIGSVTADMPLVKLIKSGEDYAIGSASAAGFFKFSRPGIELLKDRKNFKYVVASALSLSSGLYLGYRLSTTSLPSCDSKRALYVVNTIQKWPAIEYLMLIDCGKRP